MKTTMIITLVVPQEFYEGFRISFPTCLSAEALH